MRSPNPHFRIRAVRSCDGPCEHRLLALAFRLTYGPAYGRWLVQVLEMRRREIVIRHPVALLGIQADEDLRIGHCHMRVLLTEGREHGRTG